MILFRFLGSRVFWVNICLILLFGFILLFATFRWLNAYTRHGESLAVPDIRNMPLSRAEMILKEKNLRYQVTDTLFAPGKAANTVIDQNPVKDEKVKEGRIIYITINGTEAPKVKMPRLVDVSYRQAVSLLLSCGLKEGDTTYRSDLAHNVVLAQLYKGKNILPDSLVPKGATIDLVLGDGMGGAEMEVPQLEGLSYEEASFVLEGSGLKIGKAEYAEGVDQKTARVYLQKPAFGQGIKISQGQSIDIFLK